MKIEINDPLKVNAESIDVLIELNAFLQAAKALDRFEFWDNSIIRESGEYGSLLVTQRILRYFVENPGKNWVEFLDDTYTGASGLTLSIREYLNIDESKFEDYIHSFESH